MKYSAAEIDAERDAGATQPPPLPDIQSASTYPIHALGELLGSAAHTIAEVVQVPLAIAAQSVLATAAMVAQQRANVVIGGRIHPLSLFCLTVAASGDRKSSADSIARDPLERWQRERIENFNRAFAQYQNEIEAYTAQRTEILRAKSLGSHSTKADSLAALEPPSTPVKPFVICSEPTLEGLQKSFVGGHPSQGLFSDEGGQFFGGHAMSKDNALKTMAGLSKLWDGAPIVRTRAAQGESIALSNRRLSGHLMVQPIIATIVLSDPMMREQGFLARFLVVQPRSIAGTRLYNYRDATKEPAITSYQQHLYDLLCEPIEIDANGGLELRSLSLSDDAMAAWVECYDEIEIKLGSGNALEAVRASAAKMAENIARIAGVLAVIDKAAQIEMHHMAGALQLGEYYLVEQLRIAQRSEADTAQRRAVDLLQWLRERGGVIAIDDISKKAPRATQLRNKVEKIREAMADLVALKYCVVDTNDKIGNPSAWRMCDVPA